MIRSPFCFILLAYLIFPLFFLNDTAPTEIYTLSLHAALPIPHQHEIRQLVARVEHPGGDRLLREHVRGEPDRGGEPEPREKAEPQPLRQGGRIREGGEQDRKSTRLNSSHGYISYAVFCLKKKK